MRNPREVLSKAQILDRVWNYDFGAKRNRRALHLSLQEDRRQSSADDSHPARRWRAAPGRYMTYLPTGQPNAGAIANVSRTGVRRGRTPSAAAHWGANLSSG